MGRVRLPLRTQSCNVWIDWGQPQSQVWLSIDPACVFRFMLASEEKSFTHWYVVEKERRKHTALSESAKSRLQCFVALTILLALLLTNNEVLWHFWFFMLNGFLIQMFTLAVTEKCWRNCSPNKMWSAMMLFLTFESSLWKNQHFFLSLCLVVRWHLRCYGFMDSFLRTSLQTTCARFTVTVFFTVLLAIFSSCTSVPNSSRLELRWQGFWTVLCLYLAVSLACNRGCLRNRPILRQKYYRKGQNGLNPWSDG